MEKKKDPDVVGRTPPRTEPPIEASRPSPEAEAETVDGMLEKCKSCESKARCYPREVLPRACAIKEYIRGTLIGRIEGKTGALTSMPYYRITTEDLLKILGAMK
jgi:hypothetical protein